MLIFQRLLEATEQSHEDFVLLRKAEKEIHELAVKISTIEKESNEQEVTYFLMDLIFLKEDMIFSNQL